MVGGQSPVMDESITIVQADGQIGVAYVNGEQHFRSLSDSGP
jgi:hypothetical protein